MPLEESLNDFKRSIRAKLQLPQSVRLHLAETRNGRLIDLDDGMFRTLRFPRISRAHQSTGCNAHLFATPVEDDFEAFQAVAGLETQLEVEVGVNGSDDHVGPSIDTVAHEVSLPNSMYAIQLIYLCVSLRGLRNGGKLADQKSNVLQPRCTRRWNYTPRCRAVLMGVIAANGLWHTFLQAESVVAASRDDSPIRGRSLRRLAPDESKSKKKHNKMRSQSRARTPPPAPLLTRLIEVSDLCLFGGS